MLPLIAARNLGKRFFHQNPRRPMTLQERCVGRYQERGPSGEFWALRHVDLSIGTGRTIGVVGANGAGKSTLLKLICRIGRPDEGTLETSGRIYGMLDLDAGFHSELTGRENAFMSGIVAGLRRHEVASRFDDIVTFAELEEFIDDPLRTYSSGMQLRLAFAVSVSLLPLTEVLVIDEVLAVGDAAFRLKCIERIMRFRADGGTILAASHDDAFISSFCEEAVWLRDGRVVAFGPAAHVVRSYTDESVRGGAAAPPEAAPLEGTG